jgi:uncharacterized protein (DUF2236 family)
MPRPSPSDFIRNRLVGRVRAVFNDVEHGQEPVPPSDDALFEKDSPIRLVHADAVSMMVGGIRSLLLQMLHPHALQGVLDHSNFREDMHGRLRRTARFIAITTFGHLDEAAKIIDRVNRIHVQVNGTLPDGTGYSAQNPRTLAWVHVAEAVSFLEAYLHYVNPSMSRADQDEYFRQFAIVARMLGADPVPETKAEAEALFDEFRADLHPSAEAREIADLVLNQRPKGTPPGVQTMLGTAAVDLLPSFARPMLGLQQPGLSLIPTKIATHTVGRTLRWAFKQ